jgi:hypothetical protein
VISGKFWVNSTTPFLLLVHHLQGIIVPSGRRVHEFVLMLLGCSFDYIGLRNQEWREFTAVPFARARLRPSALSPPSAHPQTATSRLRHVFRGVTGHVIPFFHLQFPVVVASNITPCSGKCNQIISRCCSHCMAPMLHCTLMVFRSGARPPSVGPFHWSRTNTTVLTPYLSLTTISSSLATHGTPNFPP